MVDEVIITSGGIQQYGRFGRIHAVLPLVRLWVIRDLRSRYRQSVLRSSWSIIQPTALLLTYGWVFTAVLDVPQGGIPYLSFAWAGLVVYNFAAQSLTIGVGSIIDAGDIVQKVYFPREVLPLAVVGVAASDMLGTVVILVVLGWVQVGHPTIHLIGSMAGLVVMIVWVAAGSILAGTLAVRFRDIRHAMPLFLRVLFILSPIMYSVDLLGPNGVWISRLNPLAVCMEALRDGVLSREWPNWSLLGLHAIAGLTLLTVCMPIVRRAELLISDRL